MNFSCRLHLILSWLGCFCNCEILGPRFPSPVDISSDSSLVSAGWRHVTNVLESQLGADGATSAFIGLENVTFSIGLFSTHDPAAHALQYHHISAEAKAGPGTSEVDGDSIYRVASVSKLFTVYAGLLSFDSEHWDQSITNFIPGLSTSALNSSPENSVFHTRWEDVTLRALAAQIAGIPRDPAPWISDIAVLPDVMTHDPVPNPGRVGLPPLTEEEIAPYLPFFLNPNFTSVTPAAVFEANQARPPAFPAWTTPVYANNGFVLLGIALANITGKALADVYPDLIFGPLGMTKSKSAPPPVSEWSQYVIPGNDTRIWAMRGGVSVGSGSLFTSLNDLAKFGTAIMNSTLLSPVETRKWMKPVSHTAGLSFSVGAPWEIYRYEHPSTGSLTDIYIKQGDAGSYTAFFCLLPDYEAGFTILTSAYMPQRSDLAATLTDLVTTTIIPTLEVQAAVEASRNFAGSYRSSNSNLNSSITISYNDSSVDPGLYITQFTSNGTILMPFIDLISGGTTAKLIPSIQESGQIAFRAIPGKVTYPSGSFSGPFSKAAKVSADWAGIDALTYGGIGMSLFVFEVGADGRATCIQPAAMRAKLMRVS